MTARQELQLLVHKHRWAFVELVYDAKMSEANQLYGDVRQAYRYLKTVYNGRVILKKALKEIEANKIKVPVADTAKVLMLQIFSEYPWAIGEVARDEKEKECKLLMAFGIQKMYEYLKETWGSRQEVLELLRWLVTVQDGPRKSLFL